MELYERYKDRVHFVLVNLDRSRSAAQELVRKHFRGYIPHVTVVAPGGRVLYDKSGEMDTERLAAILDRALAPPSRP